jgi:ABC-2 type transport system permease protein
VGARRGVRGAARAVRATAAGEALRRSLDTDRDGAGCPRRAREGPRRTVATATPLVDAVTVDRPTAELERRARAQNRVRWELLAQLVRKDLKVKYQNSALGFAWSLLNPLFLLAVYTVVFVYILASGIPKFPVYLMSGLLAWNVIAGAAALGAGSVVGNSGLVKKVRFPMVVLPLASVGFTLVHFVLQLGVFVVVLFAFDVHFWGIQLALFPLAVALLIVWASGFAVLVSAINVRYRDTEHFLELIMFAWFWGSGAIFASGLIYSKTHSTLWTRVFYSDPPATILALMHRVFYPSIHATTGRNGTGSTVMPAPGYVWYVEQWGVAMAVSILLLYVARRVFRRMQAHFAEEL